MATTTNFGWETPDDTDLVKDGAAAIRTALGGVDTSFVDLKGGTTGQVLAKASGTDLDFTWATDASGIPATIFDAKGDIIAASAADTAARLAVGTNGQILVADSTAATGLKWATPAGGGKVLQVVMGTTTTSTSSSSATFIDTTLTATITPSSATSKVLVLVSQNGVAKTASGTGVSLTLVRGATTISTFGVLASQGTDAYNETAGGIGYLDAPATTSATTYKTRMNNYFATGTTYTQNNSAMSSIILLEIGA